ncbi:hypothetical protein ACIQMP_08080 [Streptomyces sp. NPDC091385]|uniref:hypothetical protein n=1 Tax=Streptomyces sp. NPDC091385 TaxID=3365997 RepID=UPI003822F739
MAHKLAVAAAACTSIGGFIAGDGVYHRVWETSAIGFGIFAVGIAGVLTAATRYILRQFDARTRHGLAEITEERRRLDLEMKQREAALARREAALARSLATMQMLRAGDLYREDQCREAIAELRLRVVELQREIEELNDERNQLIIHELRTSHAQFARPRPGALQAVAGADARMQHRVDQGSADVTVLHAEHAGDR